jgi:hypothetical protein
VPRSLACASQLDALERFKKHRKLNPSVNVIECSKKFEMIDEAEIN